MRVDRDRIRNSARGGFGGLMAGGCALAGAGPALAQSIVLTEASQQMGLVATHAGGVLHQTTCMTAGGAVGDFDRDGDQDVFVLGGLAGVDRLFINQGDGTFIDRAAEWGVARSHFGQGVCVGDYDNDGWLDMYVTSGGPANAPNELTPGKHLLYHNNAGAGFVNVAAEAGVAFTSATGFDGWGPAFGDFDLDGDLDLAGWYGTTGGNRFFRNNGNGTFSSAGISVLRGSTDQTYNMSATRGFTPVFIDMNADRYPELIWVSDFGGTRYFVNRTNGTLRESRASAGVALEGNGMGVAVADFNNDGRPDFYVTSIFTAQPIATVPGTGNMLYINQGANQFSEVSASAGVKDGGWGWGAVGVDLDNDGWQDIFETNGWPFAWTVPENFIAERSYVFRNNRDLTFAEVGVGAGVNHLDQGRGAIRADLDNDGDQDILVFCYAGDLRAYRNDLDHTNAHFLRVFLDTVGAPTLAPDGVGAKVSVTVAGQQQHRWIGADSSFLSQSEGSAHFGLGEHRVVDELRVVWPNGRVTILNGVNTDRTIHIGYKRTDWNLDGRLNHQDFFDFLNAFFGPGADYNLDAAFTDADFFGFVTDFFERNG